jgi:hypothetical protein
VLNWSLQSEIKTEAVMKKGASRRVLFVGVAVLLSNGVSWSQSTKTTAKATLATTSATKPKRSSLQRQNPEQWLITSTYYRGIISMAGLLRVRSAGHGFVKKAASSTQKMTICV